MVKKLVSIAFVILIGMPLIGTTLSWSNFVSGEYKEQPGFGEEGERTDFPEAHLTPDFFTQMDAYISENFAFRDELVYLNALRDVTVLRSSFNNEVLIGKDGYLFLSETLREEALSDNDLNKISEFFQKFEADVEACGAKALFVFVPDKKTIYKDELPNRILKIGYSNYEKVIEKLDKEGIEFVNLKKVLEDAYQNEQVYSKLDTHWNRVGAYLGFVEILRAFNLNEKLPYTEGTALTYERAGDLSRMLGLEKSELTYEPDLKSGELKYSDKVTLYYDSFGLGLMPFLNDTFYQIDSYHIMGISPFWGTESCWGMANYVVIEIVERDISYLLGADS